MAKKETSTTKQEKKLQKQALKDARLLEREKNKKNKKIIKQQEKELRAKKKRLTREIIKQKRKEASKQRAQKSLQAEWFKLDNAAIIYPSIKEENWTFVFRISAVLKNDIDVEKLQQAVYDTMKRFPTFNVSLKQGLFWNYFECKSTFPKVKKESKFPCHNFDIFSSKDHIVRVLYYNKRISVECFHGIADGRGALKFFNSLLKRYFTICGAEIYSNEGCLSVLDKPRKEEMEDAFAYYSTKGEKLKHKESKAFKLTGTEEEFGVVNTTMGTMSVAKVKEVAKAYGASLTEFLVANLAYCIWKKNKNHKKPIKVSVPIDLRNYFETETLRNFSGYINIELPPKSEEYTIEQIIDVVKYELSKINKEFLQGFINSNVSIQKNFFIKIVPLFLKNIFIKLFFKAWGEAYQTINFSNIGKVSVPEEFEGLVDKYSVDLGRPKYNAKTIGLISFGDKMVLSISSKVKENDLEQAYFSILAKYGIDVMIETNRRDIYA